MADLGMLILGIHNGESICIGDNVTVTLLAVQMIEGKLAAKIGIDAPKYIEIHRKEVWLRIQDCRKRKERGI